MFAYFFGLLRRLPSGGGFALATLVCGLLLGTSAAHAAITTSPLVVKGHRIATQVCNDANTAVAVGIATYKVVVPTNGSAAGGPTQKQLDRQILFDFQTAQVPAHSCIVLSTRVPMCDEENDGNEEDDEDEEDEETGPFQTDVFLGGVITDFKKSTYYAGRLLDGELFFHGTNVTRGGITAAMLAMCHHDDNGHDNGDGDGDGHGD